MKKCHARLALWILLGSTYILSARASSDEDEDESGSSSGSGDEPWNSYGDEDDYFSFVQYGDTSFHWSDYAIYPDSCLVRNKEDLVVFSMYAADHNGCKKKSMGKYYLSVADYVLAAKKTAEKDAELEGNDYDEPAASDYLQCNAIAYDDENDSKPLYTKLGCNPNNWKQFSIKTYTDEDCTVLSSGTYYYNIDVSDVYVEYKSCNSCSDWAVPDDEYVDDQFEYNSEYFSPLCTAAWYYKQICDSSCIRAARITTGEIKPRRFTLTQTFFLLTLIVIGVFFFLNVYRERRRMSEEDAMYEEASVASVGIKRDYFPKMFLGYICLTILLIIFKAKRLVFTMLIITDASLMMYFARLQYRSTGRVEIGRYHIYGEKEDVEMT